MKDLFDHADVDKNKCVDYQEFSNMIFSVKKKEETKQVGETKPIIEIENEK